ncbi:MAG: thiamine pyrophosphate-dependent enzyme [Methanomassiliicoccales archaeon]
MKLKELVKKPQRLTPGHRLCAGCPESIIARQVLMSTDHPVVIATATGCFEVSTSIFPYTAWNVPFIHSAFENVAATIAGAESAYNALRRKGQVKEDIRFVAFAGDGGTYDIGLQSLSGAIERGHNFLYVCLNNEAYMNTGIQRSGATTRGAQTTTCPAGTCIPGKRQFPKDMTRIIAAHDLPYAAQVSPHNWKDLIDKASKGFEAQGPAFLNAVSPCPRGWRYDAANTIEVAKLAVETCIWPLYEVVEGDYTLTADSKRIAEGKKEKKPVVDWLKTQGRFRHLMKDEWSNVVEEIQESVDQNWERLQKLAQM